MAIQLPATPGVADGTRPRLISNGVTFEGFYADEARQFGRLGDRFGIDVQLPPMEAEPDGRVWVARLLRGKREGVVFNWPLDTDPGDPGTPVAVSNASPVALRLGGLTSGYQAREGQFFSVVVNGRRYLHQFAADGVADESGVLDVRPVPALRVEVPAASVVEIAAPKIEGQLVGNETGWTVQAAPIVGLSFSINEVR